MVGDAPQFFLRGNQRQTVTLRLKLAAENPSGRFTLRLESTHGGVDERSLLFAEAARRAGAG